MGVEVVVREIDGGRAVEMAHVPGHVILEAGGHSYLFDEALFLHAVKRLMGISLVIMGMADMDVS